jgi:hypothetical protein
MDRKVEPKVGVGQKEDSDGLQRTGHIAAWRWVEESDPS